MDFRSKKSTAGIIAGFDMGLSGVCLIVASFKIVEAVLKHLSPEAETGPITLFTMIKAIILWFGLFLIHVVPVCHAFALWRITGKGREEVLGMIDKSKAWIKSTLYLMIALFVMFILFSLNSDVQSYVGSIVCVTGIVIRLFSRCFVQNFYESLTT